MTSVTIVVPAYNEGSEFACALVRIADYYAMHERAGYHFRYLVVDDGSTDDTCAVASEFARWHKDVTVVRHAHNRGLGAAMRTAFAQIDSEYAIVLDADLSYTPTTGMQLLEALERQNADIALASAYVRGGSVSNVPRMRRILSREANRFLALAAAGRYSTFTCMVRAYRVSSLARLTFESDRMAAVPELLFSAIKQGMRIIEVPAALAWSDERRSGGGRLSLARAAAQTMHIVQLGLRHRPSLWLAVPGLFPGLLPLVVAVLLLMHVSAQTLAIATAVTVTVQYSSLALFAGQVGAFFARTLRRRQPVPLQKRESANDYHSTQYDGTSASV